MGGQIRQEPSGYWVNAIYYISIKSGYRRFELCVIVYIWIWEHVSAILNRVYNRVSQASELNPQHQGL